jgi:hypothetical protein
MQGNLTYVEFGNAVNTRAGEKVQNSPTDGSSFIYNCLIFLIL